MSLFSFVFRVCRKIILHFNVFFQKNVSFLIFKGNQVNFHHSLICNGIPKVDVHRKGSFIIGSNCRINSGTNFNPIGRYSPSVFMIRENAIVTIGNNVGMSSTAIICHKEIIIEDNVKIGGGVCIYDTDFHSLNPFIRLDKKKDGMNAQSKTVHIKKMFF